MTDMAEVLESGLAEARERERIAARAAQADALELRNAAMDAGLPVHEHLVELWLNAYDGRPTPDDGPQVDRAAAAQWAPAPGGTWRPQRRLGTSGAGARRCQQPAISPPPT